MFCYRLSYLCFIFTSPSFSIGTSCPSTTKTSIRHQVMLYNSSPPPYSISVLLCMLCPIFIISVLYLMYQRHAMYVVLNILLTSCSLNVRQSDSLFLSSIFQFFITSISFCSFLRFQSHY